MFAMKPFSRIPSNKIGNTLNGNSVFTGDVGVAHSGNVIFEQGYHACVRKNHIARSSFLGAIDHIVGPTACRQVAGIYTSWIITGMHDMHSYRNWSICILIGKTVSKLFANVRVYGKKTVSGVVLVGSPLPAFVFGFYGNLGPETFIKHKLNMMASPSEVNG